MESFFAIAFACLMATTHAMPVNVPVISAPLNWPAAPPKVSSHFGGMRPTARIADGSSHLLERIIDAQTLLYAMLIVAVEPKPVNEPAAGYDTFYPEALGHHNGVNEYAYGMPEESFVSSDNAENSEDDDMAAVPYDLVAPKMVAK